MKRVILGKGNGSYANEKSVDNEKSDDKYLERVMAVLPMKRMMTVLTMERVLL